MMRYLAPWPRPLVLLVITSILLSGCALTNRLFRDRAAEERAAALLQLQLSVMRFADEYTARVDERVVVFQQATNDPGERLAEPDGAGLDYPRVGCRQHQCPRVGCGQHHGRICVDVALRHRGRRRHGQTHGAEEQDSGQYRTQRSSLGNLGRVMMPRVTVAPRTASHVRLGGTNERGYGL